MQTSGNVAFQIGALLAALVAFGTRERPFAWRLNVLLECVFPVPLLTLLGTSWLAESPRWLVRNGRAEEAARILRTLHPSRVNSSALADHELLEIQTERDLHSDCPPEILRRWKSPILDKKNRRQILILVWVAWVLSMAGVSGLVKSAQRLMGGQCDRSLHADSRA